jgi:hypothetical protein
MRLNVLLAALLLGACGTAPNPFGDPGTPGFAEKQATDYLYKKLLIERQGWQVWELADKDQVTCMAIKPAKGAPWPSFSNEQRLSFNKDYKALRGGAGFFMYAVEDGGLPVYGFYGKHPYRWLSVAESNDQRIADINNQATILSWEGADIAFQVDTQPTQFDSTETHTASGTVDFTGVTQAHAAMLECHARVARG